MYLYNSSAVCLLALSELVLYTINWGLLIDTALHLPHSFFSYNKPIPVPRFSSFTWEHFGIIGRFSQSWCTFCCPADSVKALQRTQSTDLIGRNSPTAERVLLPLYQLSDTCMLQLLAGSTSTQCLHRYTSYSVSDFEVFHPAGVTYCTDGEEIWRGGVGQSRLIHAKFHSHWCRGGAWGPKDRK